MSLTSHRCCARQKILKQAWIFSATPTITPPGLCIYRKAINKNKPSLSSGVLPLTLLNLGCTRQINPNWSLENGKFFLMIDFG